MEKRKFLAVEGKQAKRITKLLIVILTNNVMLRSSDQPGNTNKDLWSFGILMKSILLILVCANVIVWLLILKS